MKKTSIALTAFAILATCLASAYAIPTGKSNESGHYISGTGISHMLNAGIYGGSIEREVEYNNAVRTLESKQTVVYLGLEVTPWATVFVGGGLADHQVGMLESDTSSKLEAGILLNLVDHVILDPTLFEDKLRINAGASWAYTEAEWLAQDVRWQEATAFLTVSIVNDTIGNKFFNPNSVAIYMGPMFNYIQSGEIELREEFGFLAGIELFLTESISLDIGMRHLDTTGFEGGINIDF
ncbi:MAG: hypothetical protein ISS31_05140 [Kiritimatiellae bacterium]|nr:hypothetical protein [Kiritimatiellia bacterium]